MEQSSIPELDREVFERVWRRVMPEDRADCPFTIPEDEAGSPEALPTLPVPAGGDLPAVISEEADHPEAACLGPSSAGWGEILRRYIDDELADWRRYQGLARRASGSGGRTLAAMAGDERRHAKKLSTVYFLLSGVRYWPEGRAGSSPVPLHAALRERFWAEQQGAAAYQASAAEAADPCLKELFTELAGEEEAHAWTIRGVLEQL